MNYWQNAMDVFNRIFKTVYYDNKQKSDDIILKEKRKIVYNPGYYYCPNIPDFPERIELKSFSEEWLEVCEFLNPKL
jgi:hypothetical protein